MRRSIAAVLALACVALLVSGAGGSVPAGAQQTTERVPLLVAYDVYGGWVSFRVSGHLGATVAISEITPGVVTPLRRLTLHRLVRHISFGTPWLCSRSERFFRAVETLPSGTTRSAMSEVATPSCAGHLHVSTWPDPPRAGAHLIVTFSDDLRLAHLRLRICAQRLAAATTGAPAAPDAPQCQGLSVPRLSGAAGAQAIFTPSQAGMWRVTLRARGIRIVRDEDVQAGLPTLLATGDSEIQVFDDFITSALAGRMHVISEAHISTGLSNLGFFDWLARAGEQAQTERPDVTVVFIGANDGFPVPDPATGQEVSCCGQPWIEGYAARVEQMMGDYLRDGSGEVYWFTLPVPRPADFARNFVAIDAAFEQAAAHFPHGVHLIDDRPIFTPGGRYEQYITYDGQTRRSSCASPTGSTCPRTAIGSRSRCCSRRCAATACSDR